MDKEKKPYTGKNRNRKGRKAKTCKICKSSFIPVRDLQPVCSQLSCQIEYANKHLAKQKKAKKTEINKAKREFKAKDKTTLRTKAQQVFNAYIRERDKGQPCISCGCIVEKGHASHFYSVGGHSAVRFHTDNVHLSCVKCNVFLHGNLVPYKPALIKKIGQDRFDKLTELSRQQKNYNSVYYQRIIDIFTKKRKKLKSMV